MKIKSIGSNKTEIEIKDCIILISYETPVAAIRLHAFKTDNPSAAIKTDQFWSVTTSKHINQWLIDNGHVPGDVPQVNQEYFDTLLDDNT